MNIQKTDGRSVTVGLPELRSLRTRHAKPQLITKLIEQTKSYQDGTGNPAMLPKLMARTLRQIEGGVK